MSGQDLSSGRVAMTGAGGFLGWHTRAALEENAVECTPISAGAGFDLESAARAVHEAQRLIHVAGVNRGSDDDVLGGNIRFAEQVAGALRRAEQPPPVVIYANSTQAGNATVYGEAKARAGDVLAAAASAVGAEFVDLQLPNLFGEHGRPFYNAVTATFCHILAEGGEPTVEQDKQLTLLHAQNAADLLTGTAPASSLSALQKRETVSGLLGRLRAQAETYGRGEIPDIADTFERDLFNTYRSHTAEHRTSIPLVRHVDERGAFFEVIRTHGGAGQSSFSTTAPGVSRGDHYHRRKVERFTVLSGKARISLRRLYTREVLHIDVEGDSPVAVDMPTMWAHKITNTGTDPLYTAFWTNDLFDPSSPDTVQEPVSTLEVPSS